jgi:hypothetical protein
MAFDLHNLEREKFNINCAVNKGFSRMPWLRYSPEAFEVEKSDRLEKNIGSEASS